MAISLLLAAIGVGWYFTRSQVSPRRDPGESATVSLSRTKTSDRAAPDPERERRRQQSISKATQRWYEDLLEKHPQMKPAYRAVPDEQNGFLQFLLLAEGLNEPNLPEELRDMLSGSNPWEPAKFKAWLAENQSYVDQILHVAELPDRSIKGLDFARLRDSSRFDSEFAHILTAAARLAFESGDQEAALRYGKASISLSNHLSGIEVPSLLGQLFAEQFRRTARQSFLENIMPGLANNPQALTSWRKALFHQEELSSELARIPSGEWNLLVRTELLPALLGNLPQDSDEAPIKIPNDDALIEHYTAATQKWTANMSNSAAGRLDLSHSELEFPESGIDPITLQLLHGIAFSSKMVLRTFESSATSSAMISAALAVQLGEEPPIEPISGKPFQWNPESRTLSSPEGVDGLDPIKLR